MHWVDGVRAESLPLPDRGLNFGDGLFETMLFAQQRIFYRDLHLDRLEKGIKALGFPECLGAVRDQLSVVADELLSFEYRHCAVRLTLTRGDGPRGYAPGSDCKPRVIISVSQMDQDWQKQASPATTGFASIAWSNQPQLAGLKHLNRLEQVLAARERVDQGLDELIMLDGQSSAISTVSGNLFAVIDDTLLTPKLDRCGIEGTRRRLILDSWSRELGIETCEVDISVPQLENASEAFYCNALVGLRPISSLGARTWHAHPVCEALHQIYCSENR